MHNTRFGEVEGISFDLRHGDISPDEWAMNHLGFFDPLFPPHRDEELPFIWFPWYGKFDPDLLRAEVVKEKYKDFEEYRKDDTPSEVFITDEEYKASIEAEHKFIEQQIRFKIAGLTPEAIVNPGNCISIHNIQKRVYDDDKFIPIEDRAEIQVFVKITNVNGLCILLDRPIIMKSVSSLTYARGNKPIYSIMRRVRTSPQTGASQRIAGRILVRSGQSRVCIFSFVLCDKNTQELLVTGMETGKSGSDSSFRIGGEIP